MKKRYYVNRKAQLNGDHEVHVEGCTYMPSADNREYLGEFDNCADAVSEAKRRYRQSNGCIFCTPACHTS